MVLEQEVRDRLILWKGGKLVEHVLVEKSRLDWRIFSLEDGKVVKRERFGNEVDAKKRWREVKQSMKGDAV